MEARVKVFVITEAERMTAEAANSLLKVLEEPPPDNLLILTTHRPTGLLDTIISRCQAVRFRDLSEAEIASILVERLTEASEAGAGAGRGRKKVAAPAPPDRQAAALAAALARGSLTHAASLLEEDVVAKRDNRAPPPGAPPRRPRALREDRRAGRARDRAAVGRLLDFGVLWAQDLLRAATGSGVPLANRDREAAVRAEAAGVAVADLRRRVARLEEARRAMEGNVYLLLVLHRLALELAGDDHPDEAPPRMTAKTWYITCAIDYVNSNPHLGTAYEKIAADALARYHRLAGDDVYFLMGTDEHSLNVERAARKQGLEPLAYTDDHGRASSRRSGARWTSPTTSSSAPPNRATSARCRSSSAASTNAATSTRGKYDGLLLRPLRGVQAGEGPGRRALPRAPHASRSGSRRRTTSSGSPRTRSRSSTTSDAHPDFILPSPAERDRERDRGRPRGHLVSRREAGGGCRCRSTPAQRSTSGSTRSSTTSPPSGSARTIPPTRPVRAVLARRPPRDRQGHHPVPRVIWPAMLMSAGLELPKQILGHGWVTFSGEKLSKSLGNIVEPLAVTSRFGPDPLRYYLLKEVPLDRDGDFTWDLFIERYNTELANDLGNLVSRTVSMAVKYFDGDLPATCELESEGPDGDLRAAAERAAAESRAGFEGLAVDRAIAGVAALVRRANQYIEETAPWKEAKDPARRDRLATILNALLESVRLAALLLTPVMPGKCAGIRERLQAPGAEDALTLADARWDPAAFRPARPLVRPEPLFPRIEASEEA